MDVYEYEDAYSGSLQWYILRPYFMFNGERFIKTVKENSENQETNHGSFVSAYSWLLVGLLWLGNALILNLLIAIFNEIFKHIFQQLVLNLMIFQQVSVEIKATRNNLKKKKI